MHAAHSTNSAFNTIFSALSDYIHTPTLSEYIHTYIHSQIHGAFREGPHSEHCQSTYMHTYIQTQSHTHRTFYQLGMKDHILYTINGLLLTSSWITVRIAFGLTQSYFFWGDTLANRLQIPTVILLWYTVGYMYIYTCVCMCVCVSVCVLKVAQKFTHLCRGCLASVLIWSRHKSNGLCVFTWCMVGRMFVKNRAISNLLS
jgi:hypothetical protein